MAAIARIRLTPKELADSFTLLSALAEAGLPLAEALASAAELTPRPRVRSFFLASRAGLVRGLPLSRAIADTGAAVPGVVAGMLSVADRTGEGARLLAHARDYLEAGRKLKEKVQGMLAYPAIVLVILAFALAGLWFVVLPAFRQFASQMGGSAGVEVTRLAARLGRFLSAAAFLFASLALGWLALAVAKAHSPGAADRIDAAILSLPLVGQWVSLRATHEFCFAMEILLAGGLPLSAALDEAAAAAQNREFRRRVVAVRSRIQTGRSLSESIGSTCLFSPEFTQWVALGEKTGRHREVFARIRAFSGDEIERRVAGFSQVLEPGITVALGIVMMAFIAGFIVPLFGIYGNLL